MDNIIPIASSRKSVDTLAGKILVAKTTHVEYFSRINGSCLQAKPGMMIVALMEETSSRYSHQKVVKFIYNGLHGELALNNNFDNNWGIISPDDRLGGKAFVFTGALTNTRDYYKTLVECFGGVFGSAVSKSTGYLVVGDPTFGRDAHHKSIKEKKARELGVPVIYEAGLFSLIQNGTV